MRTIRLETMVEYLAGREGEPGPAIRAELADPSSEASRFLEAIRLRSRALIPPQPVAVDVPTRPIPRRAGSRRLAMASVLAASLIVASGAALWLGQVRLDRLEAALTHRE